MARWSQAIWRRCPGTEPNIRPTQLIYHTAVMRDLDNLREYFCSGRSGGIESHFGVGGKWGSSPAEDGRVEQWRDTEEQADANRTANKRPDGTGAVSVETTDNAPRFPNDIEPWTPKQVVSLIKLGLWMRSEHGVPPRQCRNPGDPGFGWHGMWNDTRFEHADGSTPWTPSAGKVCPGPRRIHQLRTVIFPAVFAGQVPEEDWFDMATEAQLKQAIREVLNEEPIATDPKGGSIASRLRDAQHGVDRIEPQLGAVASDVNDIKSHLIGLPPGADI